jgi:hypothetical protein
MVFGPRFLRQKTKRAGRIPAGPLWVQTSLTRSKRYLAKKISRNVTVMSFLNSSSDGFSINTMRGATLSASLIGG